MAARSIHSSRAVAVLLTCLLVGACSGDDGTVWSSGESSSTSITAGVPSTTSSTVLAGQPTFSYTIDSSLAAGGTVEVMAAAGVTSRFAVGRIVVVFDDQAELDGIVARCSGTVVHQYATADYGVPGPSVAVVEVDPAAADLDSLAWSMTTLGADGEAAFGSEAGARVAACAAAEKAAGHRVALDWVAEPTSIPFSTLEQDSLGSSGWSRDAYQLSYYRRDAVQGIGVAEAWSLMYYAGALENRVPLAILDTGFMVDEDFREPVTHAMDPGTLVFGLPSAEGDFHGYLTAATAVGVPDNEHGVAGVAGVVAEPILIELGGTELSRYSQAMLQAYALGARIVSMSFIAPILADALPLADALDEVTAGLAEAGVLMFASSGNGGGNVDEIAAGSDFLFGTRPCQAPGVICVGGLAEDSVERHEDSTYGDPGGSVDIYAPYCVHGVPPDRGGAIWHLCGTSFSTPFAAGVAALVWAANPELTGAEVWNLMTITAQGDRWPRVNALDAVAGALPPFAGVRFVEPTDGSEHDLNTAVTLAAEVLIPTDPAVNSAEVRVRFSSDLDGLLDDHSWTVPMQHGSPVTEQRVSTVATSLSEGTHTITVTASYEGSDVTDTRRIAVGNSAPSDLRILRPANGDRFCVGEPVQLRGDAFDINEQLGLAESAFRWRSNLDGLLATGRNATATGLSVGTHRITLRVTDAGGLTTTESVQIEVESASDPDCSDMPPQVVIVAPADGADFWLDTTDPSFETGTDEHGDYIVVTLRVSLSDDHDNPADLGGDTNWYVRPDEPDTYVGSGTQIDVRLHLAAGMASQVKEISVEVYDSAGNLSTDAIEVSVNRFV
jgi:serine protease